MILKKSSDRGADFVKTVVKNTDGAGSVTANLPFYLHADGSSVDGHQGGHPATANLHLFMGMVITTIPINGYDTIMSWGYHTSAYVSNEGSSVTITAGDALVGVAGTGLGMGSCAGTGKFITTGTTTADAHSAAGEYLSKCIVRCL